VCVAFPIASPALAERLRGNSDAQSLLDLPLIHDSNIEGWRRWLSAQGIDYTPRIQDRRFEDYNVVMDACTQGLGTALSRTPLSQGALDAGRVVPISSQSIDYHVAFHLIRPDDALRGPASEVARRFLCEAGHDDAAIAGFVATGRSKG